MNVKVKICGIRTLAAAQAAVAAGADFLGFNFVPTSHRYISLVKAREIIHALPRSVKIVGIFQNADIRQIDEYIDYIGLDAVQLHGQETPEYCRHIRHVFVIKVFALPEIFDIEQIIRQMRRYHVDYYLLDRKHQGSGVGLNLSMVKNVVDVFPIFLAGELTPENVATAVRVGRPFAVDVAGGIETNGQEDVEKIRQFIQTVRKVDKYI